MGQRQGQRRGASHHLAVLIVLGAVAWAAELAGTHTAKVRAHGQQSEVLDVVLSRDQVVGLALQALDQVAVVGFVALDPALQR